MRTIYRFDIPIQERFSITMPLGATILCLSVQDRAPHFPSMWCFVDSTQPPVERHFVIMGTGKHAPDDVHPNEHVGTFQMHGFVWHVFEVAS